MGVSHSGRARTAAVPVWAVEALPPHTDDALAAKVACGWVSSTLFILGDHGRVDRQVDSLFETSVEHRFECVGGRVQVTSVEQWQARTTEIVIVADLLQCQ